MPEASSHVPKRITLFWGPDRLEIDDPIWIAKIVNEMHQNSQPDDWMRLVEPRSRRNEQIDASLRAKGFGSSYVDPNARPIQIGYQAPEQLGPVATEALRLFLGLELPVALNFRNYSGRSEHRMSAVHTVFRQSWHRYNMPDELNLCWLFNGYQLYATHHIGAAHVRPYPSESMDRIERRLLNGQWVRWSFDGASPSPAGRHWSERRTFSLTGKGIQLVDSGASLESED